MASSDRAGQGELSGLEARGPELAYLCVDAFMQDVVSARALTTAFETGLVDLLVGQGEAPLDAVAARLRLDRHGLELLSALLATSGAIAREGAVLRPTVRFLDALRFRDLMEAKLAIANLGVRDLLDHFTEMVRDPVGAMGMLAFCRLFAYDRCLQDTPDNDRSTRRWMAITSVLTRYEAGVCLQHHDFGRHLRMLDIGGNSGEFALRVCRQQPRLRAVVADLPVVCRIGREHVAGQPEAERIEFVVADALRDRLPGGADLVTFKSVLHDWPEAQVRQLLSNGSQALCPGGSLLIFERGPLRPTPGPLPFSAIPFLLFYGAYRSPALYEEQLRALGFERIQTRQLDLEVPFHLVTAVKGS